MLQVRMYVCVGEESTEYSMALGVSNFTEEEIADCAAEMVRSSVKCALCSKDKWSNPSDVFDILGRSLGVRSYIVERVARALGYATPEKG